MLTSQKAIGNQARKVLLRETHDDVGAHDIKGLWQRNRQSTFELTLGGDFALGVPKETPVVPVGPSRGSENLFMSRSVPQGIQFSGPVFVSHPSRELSQHPDELAGVRRTLVTPVKAAWI